MKMGLSMGSTTSLSPRMTQSILLSKPSSSQRLPYRDNHELKFFTKTISSSESFPSGPICSLGKYFAVDIDYQILEPLQYPLRGDNLPKRDQTWSPLPASLDTTCPQGWTCFHKRPSESPVAILSMCRPVASFAESCWWETWRNEPSGCKNFFFTI